MFKLGALGDFVTFGSPGGGPGGGRMGPHLGPPWEPPKSILGKKPLSTQVKAVRLSYGYILKRAPRRGRAGAPFGARVNIR